MRRMVPAVLEMYDARREKISMVVMFVLTYTAWISLSYYSTHLYAHFCAEWSIMGFLTHPFMVSSPHCLALKWVMNEGSSTISNLFAMIATYVATTLVIGR